MKKILVILGLLTSLAQAEPRVGINFNMPEDWTADLPFVDVFRTSRPWSGHQIGTTNGPALALDEFGWVKKLESGCFAESVVLTGLDGHFPSGVYTVLYEGDGKIEFGANVKVTESKPGRILINVDSSRGLVSLRIMETNPQNYIRHIHIIMPGSEKTWEKEPFNPEFLKRWTGFACFRFMDWMQTNGSKISKWSERPTPQHQTYCRMGVALEVMIDLCNRQKVNPWFCMPHLADDDYVRNFAQMVKDRLDPKLRAYVEYSNEVWNGAFFKQYGYVCEQGTKLNLGAKPWEAGWHFTAKRSVEIFKIWENVFGGHDRFIRVIPTQGGNGYHAEQLLTFGDTAKYADVLAMAPYLQMVIGPDSKNPDMATVTSWSVEQVLDYVETKALPEMIGWMQKQKTVADKYGIKLVCYEAGQHLVGKGEGMKNEAMMKLFQAANRHPRMGTIYTKYLDAWAAAGGDLMNLFNSTSKWNKYGNWGLAEHADSKPADYPKLAATLEWAKKHGQPVQTGN